MGYLTVTEARLQELREKHRPAVLLVVEERSKGGRVWKDPNGLATKLYSFKHDPELLIEENKGTEGSDDALADGDLSYKEPAANLDDMLSGLSVNSELEGRDLQEQVAPSFLLWPNPSNTKLEVSLLHNFVSLTEFQFSFGSITVFYI